MKVSYKDSEKLLGWDHVRRPSTPTIVNPQARVSSSSSKLMLFLLVFISSTYLLYTFRLLSSPNDCPTNHEIHDSISSNPQFISAASRIASQSNESVDGETKSLSLMPPPPPNPRQNSAKNTVLFVFPVQAIAYTNVQFQQNQDTKKPKLKKLPRNESSRKSGDAVHKQNGKLLPRFYQMGNYWRFFFTVEAEATYLQFCIIEPYANEWAQMLET